MSKDLFGISDKSGANDDDDVIEHPGYVIVQLIPAEGWTAVFRDSSGQPSRVLGLACFALIELLQPDPGLPPLRVTRPMIVDETGQIEDVEAYDDFVCIVRPGGDPGHALMGAEQIEKAGRR